jgi:hypothetical protein
MSSTGLRQFNFVDELIYALENKLKTQIKEYQVHFIGNQINGVILNKSLQLSLAELVKALNYIPVIKNISSNSGRYCIQQDGRKFSSSVNFGCEPVNEKLSESLLLSLRITLTQSRINFSEESIGILRIDNKTLITCFYTRPQETNGNVIYCNEISDYEGDKCIGYYRVSNGATCDYEHLALIYKCEKCGRNEIYDWMDLHFTHKCM